MIAALLLTCGCDRIFLDAPPAAPEFCDPLPFVNDVTDLDADGVTAREDNCVATKNADQADEDNDCRGDVCDACPWRGDVDSDGPDSDGDGLVDACDRGDATLRVFDPFNESVPNRWLTPPPYEPFELGMSTFEARTAGRAAVLLNNSISEQGAFHAGLRIPDATLEGTEAFVVGALVISNGIPTGIGGYRISIARDAGDPQIWFRLETLIFDKPTVQTQNAITTRLFGRALRIDVDFGPTITARLAVDSRIEELPLIGAAPNNPNGNVGLTAIGTPATFEFAASVR